jgi:drug/metabolite transporter (DMT)-like permease
MTGYLLVAAAAVGWGMWPLVLRQATMAAELESAIVMLVITILSLPLVLRDRVRTRATPRDWLGIVWLGIADSGNVAFFFAAYQRTTVAIAVLTHYLTPIFVAVLAPFVLGEQIRRRTALSVVLAMTGLVVLLDPFRRENGGLGDNDLIGAALGAGSAVFYASNVLVTKRIAPVFSGSELLFFHGLVGTPLLFAFVPRAAYAGVSSASFAVVIAGSIVIGAGCGLMFVSGLRRIAASHASILTLLEPFVAVTSAVVFLGERFGPLQIAGGTLVLIGAVLVVPSRQGPDRVE